jgi:hypothetical protein
MLRLNFAALLPELGKFLGVRETEVYLMNCNRYYLMYFSWSCM